MNSRESRAANRQDYIAASWYAADHAVRWATWAQREVRAGRPVDCAR